MCYIVSKRSTGAIMKIAQEDIAVLKWGKLTEHGEFISAIRHYGYIENLLQPTVPLKIDHENNYTIGIDYGYHSIDVSMMGEFHRNYVARGEFVTGLFTIPKGAELFHYEGKAKLHQGDTGKVHVNVYVSSQIIYKGIWKTNI